jgi:hypothetical protein
MELEVFQLEGAVAEEGLEVPLKTLASKTTVGAEAGAGLLPQLALEYPHLNNTPPRPRSPPFQHARHLLIWPGGIPVPDQPQQVVEADVRDERVQVQEALRLHSRCHPALVQVVEQWQVLRPHQEAPSRIACHPSLQVLLRSVASSQPRPLLSHLLPQVPEHQIQFHQGGWMSGEVHEEK